MKAETQANNLASLVQNKKPYPEYELVLPFFEIKQSALKKLTVGDVLLLGLSYLDMNLLSEGHICANVQMDSDVNKPNLQIKNVQKDMLTHEPAKKYAIVKGSFGVLQSRKLEVGYKVSMTELDLQKINLFVEDKNIALGTLVTVDDEIAIQITKVNL